MQKESSKIKVSNFFKKEDPIIVRWVVALAMASQDICFCAKKIKNTQIDYEKIYYFRLVLAYMREIAKVIGEVKNNDTIKGFILSMSEESQEDYLKITQYLAAYGEGTFVGEVLKTPRDNLFHYPDVKGEYWISLFDDVTALSKISIELSKSDKTIMGVRYRFIDILTWKLVKQKLSTRIISQLSLISVKLISFIDDVFAYLVIKNNEGEQN